MRIIAFLFLILSIIISGCKSDDSTVKATIEPNYEAVLKKDLQPVNIFVKRDNIDFSMFEPENGCYLGAYILQDKYINADIDTFDAITGKEHSIYTYNLRQGEPFPLSFVLECYSKGKIPHIIVYPYNNYTVFNEENLTEFAKEFGNLSIPMFVQFYPNPVQYNVAAENYISFYKKTRQIFKEYAPNTAFIWSVDFKNINESLSYYPGDEFVDWVGINIYKSIYENNKLFSRDIYKNLDYFYYSFQSKKPIMISQLGISHYSTVDHKYRVSDASNDIEKFYLALSSDYPRVKAVIYMDNNNINISPNNTIRDDYSICEENLLKESYKKAVKDKYFLSTISEAGENKQQLLKSPFKGYKKGKNLYVNLKTYRYDLNDYTNESSVTIDGESYVLINDSGLYEKVGNKIILK